MTRLHHLAIGTSDVERLARFYRDVFGLVELRRHVRTDGSLRSVWLDLEGALLMIERTDELSRRVEAIGSGLFLLAFRTSAAELPGVERALERAGAPIEARTEFSAYARDPDGNRIALSHYPEPRAARTETA